MENPRIDGVLPPVLWLALIGETLQFIITGRSLDIHPFVKKGCKSNMRLVWTIFKTSLLGKPTIISTDNEVNRYILQHEGTLVELWYLDSFAKFFALEGENRTIEDEEILKDTLIERLNDPSKRRGDFLDQAIDDLETKKFLNVDFIPNSFSDLICQL
uniref:Uncharacterized protein n=1 Tax=Salix viminalis TaxID=40686 RepID=A0A6N2MBB8_SALVM